MSIFIGEFRRTWIFPGGFLDWMSISDGCFRRRAFVRRFSMRNFALSWGFSKDVALFQVCATGRFFCRWRFFLGCSRETVSSCWVVERSNFINSTRFLPLVSGCQLLASAGGGRPVPTFVLKRTFIKSAKKIFLMLLFARPYRSHPTPSFNSELIELLRRKT